MCFTYTVLVLEPRESSVTLGAKRTHFSKGLSSSHSFPVRGKSDSFDGVPFRIREVVSGSGYCCLSDEETKTDPCYHVVGKWGSRRTGTAGMKLQRCKNNLHNVANRAFRRSYHRKAIVAEVINDRESSTRERERDKERERTNCWRPIPQAKQRERKREIRAEGERGSRPAGRPIV